MLRSLALTVALSATLFAQCPDPTLSIGTHVGDPRPTFQWLSGTPDNPGIPSATSSGSGLIRVQYDEGYWLILWFHAYMQDTPDTLSLRERYNLEPVRTDAGTALGALLEGRVNADDLAALNGQDLAVMPEVLGAMLDYALTDEHAVRSLGQPILPLPSGPAACSSTSIWKGKESEWDVHTMGQRNLNEIWDGPFIGSQMMLDRVAEDLIEFTGLVGRAVEYQSPSTPFFVADSLDDALAKGLYLDIQGVLVRSGLPTAQLQVGPDAASTSALTGLNSENKPRVKLVQPTTIRVPASKPKTGPTPGQGGSGNTGGVPGVNPTPHWTVMAGQEFIFRVSNVTEGSTIEFNTTSGRRWIPLLYERPGYGRTTIPLDVQSGAIRLQNPYGIFSLQSNPIYLGSIGPMAVQILSTP